METTKKPNVLSTQVGGDHYAKYPIQPIEYIQANGLDFAQGNIVKLATRFRDKGGAEDLHKVKQYADILLALEYGEDTAPTDREVTAAPDPQEGIYLIYADGHNEPYTGANDKEDVTYIGVAFRGVRFAVALTESADDVQLLGDDTKATKRDSYNSRECDALYDFDSATNTARLLEDNPQLVDCLKAGEAIPALGVLVIMCYLRKGINRALEYVGGDQLRDYWYWSSTEYSECNAWYVNFGSGFVNYYGKYYGSAVRAVAAF